MVFSNDNGGFDFACLDAKMSIGASTWGTRLSQLRRATGEILILTRDLADIGYITNILDKRPYNIWIVAHTDCIEAAQALKAARPWLRIAVHRDIGAKAVLVAPDTVWISSSDFGKTGKFESAVGFHSPSLYSQTRSHLFDKAWREAQELMDHPEITKG
ncbi:hypothetical protein [Pseudomonas syringae]|uniref:hypothetical protein n=1 Tax=Pseudomonas syringae TaxID=317 RepID=UPI001F2FD271|nr:hypothetical protein [Pseudomonas syringae]MCF5736521.1 hypothetical protein [Pseudomonas syringae]MCF5742716.1 hypothetical protein [Pseudomonas syringae]MCF5753153.1 hypothetical protein [Pseudomonas syringae]MCF5754613.1 hypothetical protein [Pseudomonas syringae]